MSSRTSLRLQLMREQSMQQEQQQQVNAVSSHSNPIYIRMAGGGGSQTGNVPGSSLTNKTSPIIIQQPIRFTGKQLVHLPPQIIHVQSQGVEEGDHLKGGFSGSAPNYSMPQDLAGTPPKVFKQDGTGTPQQGSRNSPAELSPPGYADSPHSQHSASFTSAQSEIDDIHIIDEILSLEDEQMRRQQNRNELASSYTYANDLSESASRPVSIAGGQAVAYVRQVSNSAPSSSVDIEGLVKQEILREQEIDRDRRKKDIHNMIERRRRYNINDRIKELGMILPKSAAELNDLKMNKGTILKASVDYIRQLQREHENLKRNQQKQSQLETQNRLMMQRIKDLERHLQSHGVPVPSGPSLPVVMEQPNPSPLATSSPVIGEHGLSKAIKQEPPDEVPCPTPQAGCPQISPGIHAARQQVAASPSFTTMVEFSNLALDSHGYAAPPTRQEAAPSGGTGTNLNSVAYLFGAAMGETLETPPVLPNPTGGAPHFPQQQMNELMMDDATQANSPLLHAGDPMLSAGRGPVVPQFSPVQWDAATFSPDGAGGDQRMDITS